MAEDVGRIGELGFDGLELDREAQLRIKESLQRAIHFELARAGQDPKAFFGDGSVMGVTARSLWRGRMLPR